MTVVFNDASFILVGVDADERLIAAGTGILAASGGQDTILGAASDGSNASIYFGNKGNDYIVSNGRGDSVFGGQDNDYILNFSGSANLDGDLDNDTIRSERGDNIIKGGSGADFLSVRFGRNLFLGDEDNDTIEAGITPQSGEDTMAGGAGDDSIVSSPNGASFLFGNQGQDYLLSQASARFFLDEEGEPTFEVQPDSLYGGQGNDFLFVGSNSDANAPILTGDLNSDTLGILGTRVNGALIGGDIDPSGQLASGTDAGDDYLFTNGGNEHLLASNVGNDTLQIGVVAVGSDMTLRGGRGEDLLIGSSGNGGQFFGDLGNDSLNLSATSSEFWGDNATASGSDAYGDDTLIASGGQNTLHGDNDDASGSDSAGGDDVLIVRDGGENLLLGHGGNNFFDASATNTEGDTLQGGNGNDTYIFGPGDVVTGDSLGLDVYVANGVIDNLPQITLRPTDSLQGIGQFTKLGNQSNNIELEGGGIIVGNGNDTLKIGQASGITDADDGDNILEIESILLDAEIRAGRGSDTLTVTGTDPTSGDATVATGAGSDIITYSGPTVVAHTTEAGRGDDRISIPNTLTGRVNLDDGEDILSIGLADNGAEILGGEDNDIVRVNFVRGGASFDGGEGNDRIIFGGVGSSGVNEPVTLSGGEGDDRLGLTAEDPDFLGSTAVNFNLSGSDGDDILQGSPYADSINGEGDNDILYGGPTRVTSNTYNGYNLVQPGSDVAAQLASLQDGDRLDGGEGNDTFVFISTDETGLALQSALSQVPGANEGFQFGTDSEAGQINPNSVGGNNGVPPFFVGTDGAPLPSPGTDSTGYFSAAFGVDTITGFTVGQDLIRLDENAFDNLVGTDIFLFEGKALYGAIAEGSATADNPFNAAGNAFSEEVALSDGTTDAPTILFGQAGRLYFDINNSGLYYGNGQVSNLIAVLPDVNLRNVSGSQIVSIGEIDLTDDILTLF